jgi:hypothetical protein
MHGLLEAFSVHGTETHDSRVREFFFVGPKVRDYVNQWHNEEITSTILYLEL